MAWVLILLAAVFFAGLSAMAWTGKLGFLAIGLLLLSFVAYFLGRARLSPAARSRPDGIAKVLFTIVGMMALLRHPIEVEGQGSLPVYAAIAEYIDKVDGTTFVIFALVAMAVKFVGVITSAYAWHMLLVGQGIKYPFWQKIMTAFLIGRFIGTFLPSTLGLDGYTLYEAGRYSNQWPRVITAKSLEKFIGVTGLFLGMLITLPFGYQVIVDVVAQAGRPDAAPMLAGIIAGIAGSISGIVILGLVWPTLIEVIMKVVEWVAGHILNIGPFKKISQKVLGILRQFREAVGAYRGKLGLLFTALFAKFVTHFTTAAVYFFTALAIGVTTAEFWPITFGSTIQILGTLFSPTIAGEGAREAL
jgi:hypothetical protein